MGWNHQAENRSLSLLTVGPVLNAGLAEVVEVDFSGLQGHREEVPGDPDHGMEEPTGIGHPGLVAEVQTNPVDDLGNCDTQDLFHDAAWVDNDLGLGETLGDGQNVLYLAIGDPVHALAEHNLSGLAGVLGAPIVDGAPGSSVHGDDSAGDCVPANLAAEQAFVESLAFSVRILVVPTAPRMVFSTGYQIFDRVGFLVAVHHDQELAFPLFANPHWTWVVSSHFLEQREGVYLYPVPCYCLASLGWSSHRRHQLWVELEVSSGWVAEADRFFLLVDQDLPDQDLVFQGPHVPVDWHPGHFWLCQVLEDLVSILLVGVHRVLDLSWEEGLLEDHLIPHPFQEAGPVEEQFANHPDPFFLRALHRFEDQGHPGEDLQNLSLVFHRDLCWDQPACYRPPPSFGPFCQNRQIYHPSWESL